MSKKKLLVEGINDCHVFWNLFEQHAVPETFKVKGKDGVSTLLKELKTELRESDLECVGVVLDADADLPARWRSIWDRLKELGYINLPVVPEAGGTIVVTDGLPKVGVWLMPNNQLNGMLEDFIAYLVPSGDKLWDYAQSCVAAIENKPFGIHLSKANIHTWLAWQEEPGTPMGSAIKFHYLQADVPEALSFIAWIKRLFDC